MLQEMRSHYQAQADRHYYELKGMKRDLKSSVAQHTKEFNKVKNRAKSRLNPLTEIDLHIASLEPHPLREKLQINNPQTLYKAQELAVKLDMHF